MVFRALQYGFFWLKGEVFQVSSMEFFFIEGQRFSVLFKPEFLVEGHSFLAVLQQQRSSKRDLASGEDLVGFAPFSTNRHTVTFHGNNLTIMHFTVKRRIRFQVDNNCFSNVLDTLFREITRGGGVDCYYMEILNPLLLTVGYGFDGSAFPGDEDDWVTAA